MQWKLIFLSTLILVGPASSANPCRLKTFHDDYRVCVCTVDYCDDIEPLGNIDGGHAAIYYSSDSGKRFERSTIGSGGRPDDGIHINLETNNKYQKMLGFGGAFTDATGINLKSMNSALAEKIMHQYFSKDTGIGYTFGRVPIASTDFSTHDYSYDDTSNDFSLQQFKLADEDWNYKIPYMKMAKTANGDVKFIGSPWSAPGWMKNSGKAIGGGTLKGDFGGTYYQTWANYFVKFLEAYNGQGLPFWAVTVQNEPNTGQWTDFPWQTQYYTAETERDFIKNLLGPALSKSSAGRNVKVIALDDNREFAEHWSDTIFGDSEASKYVAGLGLHWYNDPKTAASVLTNVHNKHSDKFMLNTEASCGFNKDKIGEWYAAQLITDDMMDDFLNYVGGWVDWNLVLNTDGGPTFVNNNVKANIVVNVNAQEFYKVPLYHHMAHFSKFVVPDSQRIGFNRDMSEDSWGDIKLVPFVDPQGHRVVVVINKSWNTDHKVSINDNGKWYTLTLEKYSMATFIIN